MFMQPTRTYTELQKLSTFEERYEYLRLRGTVGVQTFGRDRWLNQVFYHNSEWKRIRAEILARDMYCDLGIPGHGFGPKTPVIVHHMNPLRIEDLMAHNSRTELPIDALAEHADLVLNPEYLISTSLLTHNGIHFGRPNTLPWDVPIVRRPGDTTLW